MRCVLYRQVPRGCGPVRLSLECGIPKNRVVVATELRGETGGTLDLLLGAKVEHSFELPSLRDALMRSRLPGELGSRDSRC